MVVVDSSDAKTRPQFAQRAIQGDERNTAAQIFAHLLLRNRALALNEGKSVRSQLRIFRSRARFWWLFGIAISRQRIKIREDGSGDKQRVFVEQIGFVRVMFAQHSDHESGCFLSPRIGKRVLPGRQVLVRSNPGADECGSKHGLPLRIHHAKSDRLKKRTRVLNRARGNAVEAPFIVAKLVKIDVGHKQSVAGSWRLASRHHGERVASRSELDQILLNAF